MISNFWWKGFGLEQPWWSPLFRLLVATDGCLFDLHQHLWYVSGYCSIRSQFSLILLRPSLFSFSFIHFACLVLSRLSLVLCIFSSVTNVLGHPIVATFKILVLYDNPSLIQRDGQHRVLAVYGVLCQFSLCLTSSSELHCSYMSQLEWQGYLVFLSY